MGAWLKVGSLTAVLALGIACSSNSAEVTRERSQGPPKSDADQSPTSNYTSVRDLASALQAGGVRCSTLEVRGAEDSAADYATETADCFFEPKTQDFGVDDYVQLAILKDAANRDKYIELTKSLGGTVIFGDFWAIGGVATDRTLIERMRAATGGTVR